MISVGKIAVIIPILLISALEGQSAKGDCNKLLKELSTLMFAKHNDVNLKKIQILTKRSLKE